MSKLDTAMMEMADFVYEDTQLRISIDTYPSNFVTKVASQYGVVFTKESWCCSTAYKKIIYSLRDQRKSMGKLDSQSVRELIAAVKRDELDKKMRVKARESNRATWQKNADRKWLKVRYQALRRDGAKCACCGLTRKDNVKLHVDHIKPVSKYPLLKYDLDNLQVLCEKCNIGKSNLYEDDWRY